MKGPLSLVLAGLLGLNAIPIAFGQHPSAPVTRTDSAHKLRVEPYTLRGFDGSEHAEEVGRLKLPESRGRSTSSEIEVAFIRLKSTAAKPGSPIIFLMGGPGIPASIIGQVPPYWRLFDRLREIADVILLDQRGLGLSSPLIDCPPPSSPPSSKMFESTTNLLSAFRTSLSQCVTHWVARGVDPHAYSVEAIADDVEDVRRALGTERVSLLAFSYGTRLALEMIRRHPQRVDRVVMAGTLGVDNTIKLPSAFDKMLVDLSSVIAADSVYKPLLPDIVRDTRSIIASAERTPPTLQIKNRSGEALTVRVGKDTLQAVIAGRLGDRRLPALVATMKQGEYSVLARMLESVYNDLSSGGGSLMARAVACSAPSSAQRTKQAEKQAQRSPLGLPFDNLMVSPDLCSALGAGRASHKWGGEVRSDRPTLFITGTLDDRTPVENAETTRKWFTNSTHVLVENGAHEVMPAPEVQTVVIDFFRDIRVKSLKLSLPKPTFASIEQAKAPPRPPGR